MSQITNVAHKVVKSTRDSSPTILTALGVSGVLTTAYLTAKASFVAAERISLDESVGGTADSRKQRLKERATITWKLYIPPVVSGAVTVACIVGATRVSSKRTAAAHVALALSERAYSEYREKVVEILGEKKDEEIRGQIAQDRINRNPPGDILVTADGQVLCMEAYTGRYFVSDMEALRKAQNDLNARLIAHTYAYLDDFYGLVGLDFTTNSNKIGWEADKMLELRFSTALSPDNRPCIVFDYNYAKPL